MAEARNPFPQPNAIRAYTQRELKRRKAGALAVPNPVSMPFVRFTSTKVDAGPPKAYRFFHMGLHGLQLEDTAEGIGSFGNIFEMTYGGQDVVGYAFAEDGRRTPITSTDSKLTKDLFPNAGLATSPRELSPAEGRHPVPGVTNVSVRHLGVNEPIETTVDWICYNTTQLEFLRQHFLMAGGYVIIEFGTYWSNREQPPLFDFSNHEDALFKLTEFVLEGRKFMSDKLFEPADGNYNMVIGRMIDQTMNFQSDGTIHCSTTFYSTGEAVFGIHNTRLLSALPTERARETFNVTINEFFSDDGLLDTILSDSDLSDFVVELKAKSPAEIARLQGGEEASDAQLQAFKSRYDSTFIPWTIFIRDVMKALFASVGRENVSADANLFTEINLTEPAIGNHPALASTDPETLIIVKPFMLFGSQEDHTSNRVDEVGSFVNHLPGSTQTFVSGTSEEKGLLTNGVWINVGAIKDSFTQTNTFYQGFMALLTRMNNATENYWHLDLAFDEETSEYKIYDKKCVFEDSVSFPKPYIFNQGNIGELLDISFEANFSKESKTAILLASRPKTKAEAIKEMSVDGFNQPSVWTEVMNLPDLKDELGEKVHSRRAQVLTSRELSAGIVPSVLKRASMRGGNEDRRKAQAKADEKADVSQQQRFTRLARFGDPILAYIANPTQLIAVIAEDGKRNPNKVNNFVSPIPTEINMSLTMQGITGLAFYDTFLVDKLPRIYRDHGVFLINEIAHGITPSGWTTTIGGLYYFVNLTGKGQPSSDPISPTEQFPNWGEEVGTGGIPTPRVTPAGLGGGPLG